MKSLDIVLLIFLLIRYLSKCVGEDYQEPEFAEMIGNLTVLAGRDVTLKGRVRNLGTHSVAWLNVDAQRIIAICDHTTSNDPRFRASRGDHSASWSLHISNVRVEDRGTYVFQIHTDPIKLQYVHLEVVVPPDIEDTTRIHTATEGGFINMACRTTGNPLPRVTWRREDGDTSRVTSYEGQSLVLYNVTRSEMGAYLCIASNSIPPDISMRFMVFVHFRPEISVRSELVAATKDTDVQLECNVEAFPINSSFWNRHDEILNSSDKYVVKLTKKSMFQLQMVLVIKNVEPEDVGNYSCVATNAMGETKRVIVLKEIVKEGEDVVHHLRNYNVPPPVDEHDETSNQPCLRCELWIFVVTTILASYA